MDGKGKPAQHMKSGRRRRGNHYYIPSFPSGKQHEWPSSGRSSISWREGMTYPRKSFYPIYCSNYGIEEFCRIVFNYIAPMHNSSKVTVDHLRYLTSLAYFWRCTRVSGHYCEYDSNFKYFIPYIELPEVLCNYIECLGTFETAMGIVVRPWVPNSVAEWYDQVGMWSPEVFLNRLGRQGSGPWFLNYEVRSEWFNCTPQFSQTVALRKVNYDNCEGTVSMMASYHIRPPSYEGTSLIAMTDMESCLGAAYQWRNIDDSAKWPGDTTALCSPIQFSRCFNLNQFLGNLVARSVLLP
nr:uncharacterized protein LOC106691803 isoform X2 [Halyomorpha halys]